MPCSSPSLPPSNGHATSPGDVFRTGRFTTIVKSLDSGNDVRKPPKPLLVASPTEEGDYPVLILLHGYLLSNSFYSQLLQHVASHGFVAVAPQLYTVAGPDTTDEIRAAASIADWLTKGLFVALPPQVRPNLAKLALSGHSRGGKVAFALALNKASITTTLPFSALIGIGPVDGMDKGKQTPPPALTYEPHSFDLNMPVMVLDCCYLLIS